MVRRKSVYVVTYATMAVLDIMEDTTENKSETNSFAKSFAHRATYPQQNPKLNSEILLPKFAYP